MTTSNKTARPAISRAMTLYSFVAVLYALLIIIMPTNQAAMHAYNLSAFQFRVILFAVSLPSLLVWFAAFWGYAKLRHYAQSVSDTPEGTHFTQLANGAVWLAWSLPMAAIVSLFFNGLAFKWSAWHPTAVVISNYAKLVPPLIAFTLVGSAARGFLHDAKLKISLNGTRTLMLFFVMAGVLYCYLVFKGLDLSGLGNSHNAYFMPIWLLVITVIVPYLYAWFVGLLGAYEIALFSKHVGGVLYRRSLQLLVIGLIAVIVSSVVTQYVGGLQSQSAYMMLDSKLLVLTIFRIIGGIGFLLLAFGADRLKKIEEV